MKKTLCDVCEEPAVSTYNVKRLTLGVRPFLLFSQPEMPGAYLDLCEEHDVLSALIPKKELTT